MLSALLPVLGLSLVADAPKLDVGSTQLLTGVVAAAASSNLSFDVVTAEDLRRALDVEAERRVAGCEDGSSSCLAEVANALGASLVLHGDVGTLGDELMLNLNLFESSTGTSGGRRAVRASKAEKLATEAEGATKELLAAYLLTHPPVAGGRVRLLVLDIKLRGDAAPPKTAEASADGSGGPPPWLLVGAGAAGLTGGAAVVVAVLLDGVARDSRLKANDDKTDQLEAQRQIDQSWGTGAAAIALYVAGPTLVVGAGVLAALHFVGRE